MYRWRRASGRYFNPRSRERSDGQYIKQQMNTANISIHAPVKGATSSTLVSVLTILHFNLRSREGSDLSCP